MRFVVFLTIITLSSCTDYRRLRPLDLNNWSRSTGYPLKIYPIRTSDGYRLLLFRVFSNSNDVYYYTDTTKNRPVVLLMHGLMSDGVDFMLGAQQGLILNLIDSGYDVYVGNTRGSIYGLSHTTLNMLTDPAFWNFSFDEVAAIDLPLIVDMVLAYSGQDRISYVGHMEGVMIFYMMLSKLPDYVNKFDCMVSLGPMAFMKNSPNRVLRKIIDNHLSQQWSIKNLGQSQFLPSEDLLNDLKNDCQNSGSKYKDSICNNYYFLIKGYESQNLNATTLQEVVLNVPYGGSVNQFLHLAQMAESGRFQVYSKSWNGRVETQEYDLSRVDIPMAVFYTPNDTFSTPDDVETLIERLPNVGFSRNFDQLTNSIDFLYSENVASNVHTQVISFLKQSRTTYVRNTYENNYEGLHPNTGKNMTEMVTDYDYPIETHEVQTEDGYILTVFRIPQGRNQINSRQTNRPAVLLMHGLVSSSADWVNSGPEKALGFVLADAGYDVWLGNQRGNTFSRKHISLDIEKNKQQFFNFSWHEIGYYDIPAKIDYILNTTQQEKLFYVGHSQGTTAFFVMTSERPEYNEKIRLMAAFAPVIYMTHLNCSLFQKLAKGYNGVVRLLDFLHLYELAHYEKHYLENAIKNCNGTGTAMDSCTKQLFDMSGYDFDQWDPTLTTAVMSNMPAGASAGQLKHFLQIYNAGKFQKYDFDSPKENIAVYGKDKPPIYDFTKVTAPIALYSGKNDWLSNVTDVQQLKTNLSNVVLHRVISYPQFNHIDFLWAKDVVQLLYNDLLDDFKKYLPSNY